MIDPDWYLTWKIGLDIIQTVAIAAAWVFGWIKLRTNANAGRIERIEKGDIGRDERLTRIESTITHLPNKADVDKVCAEVAEAKQGLSAVQATLNAMAPQVKLIHQHLLNRDAS